ncbi:MAG: penicillin-binding transpeptidase domain-containing protein [Candidatus Pacebacteria bacterium]|jgi:penicillin-binding protein 2|nr:penicillin-binding transpeptidase domain-containing protein [Candidatus Paceibacterota bacterium]
MSLFTRKRNTRLDYEIEPDEIFLDAKNIPKFDQQQFEGRLETPIRISSLRILLVVFLGVFVVFAWRLGNLQVVGGKAYYERSLQNNLNRVPLFANRGVIYDRNNVPLAWNDESKTGNFFSHRSYIKEPGFAHLLGYVSYPSKDTSGNYWREDFLGKDGLEKYYDALLRGENGATIVEVDAEGAITSQNIVDTPVPGENLYLSIDARIQTKLYSLIASLAETRNFSGGAGVIMDVTNGELLALVSFPEYDPEVLSLGDDAKAISSYLNDRRKVFLNRAVSGLYSPGSIVKPFVAIAALNENIIDPKKNILSTGSISIPNPYTPSKPTVFRDWKAHGWVDMRRAIAVSSDVYFYAVGGGYQDQKGLGIEKIDRYMRFFGIAEATGVDLPGEVEGIIPGPEWKEKNFPGDPWRIGNTYHTAIGQYGFKVTPIQMARALGAIADNGVLRKPHVVTNPDLVYSSEKRIEIPEEYYTISREGMHAAVKGDGTARALNISAVDIAAKTGTAQVGVRNEYEHSWVTGFFPYKEPRYAFVILMERGPAGNLVGASFIGSQLFQWMAQETPEYF